MTLQQVEDLREEGEALFELLDTLTDDQWALPTPFKSGATPSCASREVVRLRLVPPAQRRDDDPAQSVSGRTPRSCGPSPKPLYIALNFQRIREVPFYQRVKYRRPLELR